MGTIVSPICIQPLPPPHVLPLRIKDQGPKTDVRFLGDCTVDHVFGYTLLALFEEVQDRDPNWSEVDPQHLATQDTREIGLRYDYRLST